MYILQTSSQFIFIDLWPWQRVHFMQEPDREVDLWILEPDRRREHQNDCHGGRQDQQNQGINVTLHMNDVLDMCPYITVCRCIYGNF